MHVDVVGHQGEDGPPVKHQSNVTGASGVSVWGGGLGSSLLQVFCLTFVLE